MAGNAPGADPDWARKQLLSCICSTWPTKRLFFRTGPAVERTPSKSVETAVRADSLHCKAQPTPHNPGIASKMALCTDIVPEREVSRSTAGLTIVMSLPSIIVGRAT